MAVYRSRSLTNRDTTLVQRKYFEGLILGIALVLVLVAFGVACGSQDSESDLVASSRLESVVPPCIPFPGSDTDPCAVQDFFPTFTPHIEATKEIPEVVKTLEQSWLDWSVYPFWATHFVVRATVIPGSTRCGPPVLGVSHSAGYVPEINSLPSYRSYCYVDLAVNEYIIGQGPSRIAVTTGENPSDLGKGSCDDLCRGEGARRVQNTGIEGVEWILFLGGPRHLGQGAWEIEAEFDVQRREDGTVVVVDRYRGVILARSTPENYAVNASRLEQPLNEFRKTATNAYESFVKLTGGLTGTVSDSEGRPPPRLATDAGLLGFNDFMVRTRFNEGAPAPPPPVPGENDPNPDGLTVNDIIATRVAGGIRIPGGLEDTPTPVSALGDEPTAAATAPTPESEGSDE